VLPHFYKIQNEKEVVLQIVVQNGLSHQYASEQLKSNKDVVFKAFAQHGISLQYASEHFKNNKEVVCRDNLLPYQRDNLISVQCGYPRVTRGRGSHRHSKQQFRINTYHSLLGTYVA